MKKENTQKEEKVQLNLMLDAGIVEWINTEAKDNNMTIDEVVESLVVTMKCFSEEKDLMMSELVGIGMDSVSGEYVS